MIERAIAAAITGIARLITGVHGNWVGCLPDPRPRVYYANHASHGDFVLVWTVLPPALRRMTRPVAGQDYWIRDAVRRYLAQRVFRAVLIDRGPAAVGTDPVGAMIAAMDQGNSLIVFPEGTRNTTEERLLPFKNGLYRLTSERPATELVPVWIENLNRVMPKGEFVPIPLLCTVTFGAPLTLAAGERKTAFRERIRAALLALAPRQAHGEA
jgi:1-acyl-sn-glycerol-3-phosphate acyltransferase